MIDVVLVVVVDIPWLRTIVPDNIAPVRQKSINIHSWMKNTNVVDHFHSHHCDHGPRIPRLVSWSVIVRSIPVGTHHGPIHHMDGDGPPRCQHLLPWHWCIHQSFESYGTRYVVTMWMTSSSIHRPMYTM